MSINKIIIKNLLLRSIVGVNDSEPEEAEDILINIELFADLSLAAKRTTLRTALTITR